MMFITSCSSKRLGVLWGAIWKCCQVLFQFKLLAEGINATSITLIPRVLNLTQLNDLKILLQQTGSVEGRRLADNYKKLPLRERCALLSS
jgi:hypothetical protein